MYNCVLPTSVKEYREIAVKRLRKGTLDLKLKDFTFNLNYTNYRSYIDDFREVCKYNK